MAFIDYYKIMGVDKDTPQKDIRPAYKKRAKQFHPDLHPNDVKAKAKFQALNEAYDVLGNADKRKKYDQYGEHWKNADAFGSQQGGPEGAGNSGFDGFDFSQFSGGGGNGGFSSFFEQLFGGGQRKTRQTANGFNNHRQPSSGTINASVDLDMYTALLGGEILIQTQMGKLRLKVKPETQNGTKVRIKGKGSDRGNGTFGDLIISYTIKLPTNLTERQKQLLKEMQQAY
ncbi:MAG: DnaJ domain-containing protein [Bacteroidaceae bacterium]